ncbi:hypothetical protein BRC88_11930 [Halobacteriales archaeon QS_4_69_225]|nr:MAG: hypothetical protein BRC88_11930 [Halobacteriales archaeon QS_4_69_225]
MQRSLLVYDGSNALFRAAAAAVTGSFEDVEAVRWGTESVQAFLEAQFGGRPFAFMLVEADVVHVGEETVARVLRRGGAADPVVDGGRRAYSAVAGPFTEAVHGRRAADLHGTFDLVPEAAAHLEELRQVHEVPVREP